MIIVVDENSMLGFWPKARGAFAFPGVFGASPRLKQVAFGIELHHRRGGLTAKGARLSSGRWIWDSALLVVGQAARALVDPDVIVLVHRQPAHLAYKPVVGQRLGPGCVHYVSRRLRFLSPSR